jgi:1-phosphofructokinase family hexose kinase
VIISVTANGAVERTMSTSGVTIPGVLRAHEVVLLASGKGTNAARAANILGHPVLCTGFIAGHSGRLLAQLAKKEGLAASWTIIDGETRTAVAIVDCLASKRDALLISEPGMTTTVEDWLRLRDDVLEAAGNRPGLVCLAGSVPPGTPLDYFVELISKLQAQGHQVWVDIDGPALEAALKARPAGIKINRREAGALLGQTPVSFKENLEATQAILDRGAEAVVITLGRAGALYRDELGAWGVKAPEVAAVSSVGSGDAFLGGLAVGLAREEAISDALRRGAAAGAANTLQLGGGRFRVEAYEKLLPQVQVTPV